MQIGKENVQEPARWIMLSWEKKKKKEKGIKIIK